MVDISHHLEEIAEKLQSIQDEIQSIKDEIQTVLRPLQAEQNERSPTEGKKNLTAVEEGQCYARLQEEGHSVSYIATMTGKSGQFVRDRIALCNSDHMVKEASKNRGEGGIGLSAAIGIARLIKDYKRQRELVKRAQQSPRERRAVLEELNLVFPKGRRR